MPLPAARALLPSLLVVGLLGACTDEEPAAPPSPTGTPTPSAPEVDVPKGAELTEAGAELSVGDPATVVFEAGPRRVSVIDVAVTRVVKGSMRRDLGNFGLTAEQLRSEPYYVTVEVTNVGPAPLGGVAAPVVALDSTDTYFPATSLVGDLPVCAGGALPKPFATGDTTTTCLLFVAEPRTTVQEVQLRPYEGFEPISWVVPERVETAAKQQERRERREREREQPGRRDPG